jgi:hypothetical protein
MMEVSNSETRLRTTFNIKLNGKAVPIATVGQAYQFLTSLNSVEWMEHRSQHGAAIEALQGAAENAMLTVQATDTLRTLFVSAKLL